MKQNIIIKNKIRIWQIIFILSLVLVSSFLLFNANKSFNTNNEFSSNSNISNISFTENKVNFAPIPIFVQTAEYSGSPDGMSNLYYGDSLASALTAVNNSSSDINYIIINDDVIITTGNTILNRFSCDKNIILISSDISSTFTLNLGPNVWIQNTGIFQMGYNASETNYNGVNLSSSNNTQGTITISSGAAFTMLDGSVQNTSTTNSCGTIANGGTFSMYGGSISSNGESASDGMGVVVNSYLSTINLYGGTISSLASESAIFVVEDSIINFKTNTEDSITVSPLSISGKDYGIYLEENTFIDCIYLTNTLTNVIPVYYEKSVNFYNFARFASSDSSTANASKFAPSNFTSLGMASRVGDGSSDMPNESYLYMMQVTIYTVTYDGNGHTSGSTANSSHTYGEPSALTTNGYEKTGYYFCGWARTNEGEVEFGNNAILSPDLTNINGATVTLFAKWEQIIFTTTYTADGYTITGYNIAYLEALNDTQKTNIAIIIPDLINDGTNGLKNVVAIGDYAFKSYRNIIGNTSIYSYRIEDSGFVFTSLDLSLTTHLTSIGNGAFLNCQNILGDLIIPNSVFTIGASSFMNCCGFDSLTLPINSSFNNIPFSAFANCTALCNVLTLPNSVTSIGEAAFSGCNNLIGILDTASITQLDKYAFAGCSSLYMIYVSNVLTTYESHVFGYNSSTYPTVICPIVAPNATLYAEFTESSHHLSEYANLLGYETELIFDNNGGSSNTSKNVLFNWPINYTKESTTAIWDADNEYSLPCPVKNYYQFKAYSTNSLSTDASNDIDCDMWKISTLTVFARWAPNSYEIQYNGNGETSGTMSNSTHNYDVASNLNLNEYKKIILVVFNPNFNGSLNTNINAIYDFEKWTTNQDGTGETRTDGALHNNLTTEDGTIVDLYAQWTGGSINLIEPYRENYIFEAWYSEAEFTNLIGTVGASYTPTSTITLYAKWTAKMYTTTYDSTNEDYTVCGFNEDWLELQAEPTNITINIPAIWDDGVNGSHNITSIGNEAFKSYQNTINTSIYSYGSSDSDYIISSINLENAIYLTTIGTSAFNGCCNMDFNQTLNLPQSIETISDYAFYQCNFTDDLNVTQNVITIGARAFSNCNFNSFLTFDKPSRLISIGYSAFNSCYFTGELRLPDTLLSIGDLAFYGLSGLTGSLIIPNSVQSIGNNAFSFCTGFETVYLNNNSSYGSNAFGEIGNIASLIDGPIVATSASKYTIYIGNTHSLNIYKDTLLTYEFNIIFDTNNGNSIANQMKLYNQNIKFEKNSGSLVWKENSDYSLPMSTKTGYEFIGWYYAETDNNGSGIEFTSSSTAITIPEFLTQSTVFAKWSPVIIEINLNASTNSGIYSGVSQIYIKYETNSFYSDENCLSFYNIPNATKSTIGYLETFAGWWTEGTNGYKVIDNTGALIANISNFTNATGNWTQIVTSTLYAQFTTTPYNYTIAYNNNEADGLITNSTNVAYNTNYKTSTGADLTKQGYTLIGWALSNADADAGIVDYSLNTSYEMSLITNDANVDNTNNSTITLYAVWQAGLVNYTINHYQQKDFFDEFDDYGDIFATETKNAVADSTILIEETSDFIKNYVGFTYQNAKVGGSVVTQATIDGDGHTVINLYYNRKTTNVSYVWQTGSQIASSCSVPTQYRFGKTINFVASINNGTFNGWTSTGNGTISNSDNATTASYTITNADCEGELPIIVVTCNMKYLITFDGNGNNDGSSPSITYKYFDIDLILPANTYTKIGYTQNGWSNDTTTTSYPIATYSVNAEKTFYSNWEINQYILTINPNGGYFNSITTNSTIIQDFASTYAIPDATPLNSNYDFVNWMLTDDSYGSYDSDSNIFTFGNGPATLIAQWELVTIVLTFHDDAEIDRTLIIDYNSQYSEIANIPAITPRVGYNQIAPFWSLDNTNAITANTVFTANTTIYAVYTINHYTITFNDDLATPRTCIVEHGTKFIDIPSNNRIITPKVGYDITSPYWVIGSLTGTAIQSDSEFTSNTSLFAVYTINIYTLTFNDHIGSRQMNVNHGTSYASIAVPEIREKIGYTQTEPYWSINDDVIPDDKIFTSNETITAKYTINVYTVTFKADDVVVKTINVNHGGSVPTSQIPLIPTKVGYDQTAPNWSSANLTIIIRSIVIEAVYIINTYTVTFIMPDKSEVTYEVEYGSTVPTKPRPNGLIFGDLVQYDKDFSVITSDLTVKVTVISLLYIVLIAIGALSLIAITIIITVKVKRYRKSKQSINYFDTTTYNGRTLNDILNDRDPPNNFSRKDE